jgi:hypothetical protein
MKEKTIMNMKKYLEINEKESTCQSLWELIGYNKTSP